MCNIPIMYNLYISLGIQESMICVVDRHQILFDVASSDNLVYSTSMVNGIQLEYGHSFFIYHI